MNKEKAPAFQFYPAAFLADVGMMPTEAVGAYMLLTCYCWREGSLPNDPDELATLARLPVKKFRALWERKIKRCFTLNDEGQWVSPWLEDERFKQAENRKVKQKAANVRWNKDKEPAPSDAHAMHMHSTRNANGLQKQMHVQCSSSLSSTSSSIASPPPTPSSASSDVATDAGGEGETKLKLKNSSQQQNTNLVDFSSKAQVASRREPRVNGGAGSVSTATKFSRQDRREYADAQGMGNGWMTKSEDGRFDANIEDWINKGKPKAVWTTEDILAGI